MIRVFIPGHPRGKERARSRIITAKATGRQFTSHYTPKKTRDNENNIRSHAIGAMKMQKPMTGPVNLKLDIAFEIPKSWPKWKVDMALTGQILPTTKPDSDNIEKSIKDAFNGVIWVDDCQVVSGEKAKRYSLQPGVFAIITPLEAHPAQIQRKDLAA